ncbi:probable ran-specific GTPase-activating protein [Coccomyxa sp. Obi]|nr:probable ran-specific GTPase-activating protein [Coccomyxa sp. Obi]
MAENGKGEETKAASPSPVFGSASTFGAGTGFGGFKGVSTTASSSQAEKPEDDTPPEEGTGETEEECQAEFRPIVQLEEVERVSGEEGEKTLADFKSKLYRFDNDSGEWKERGIGQVRLLESNDTGKIRLLMRQEKTLKIRANHFVMPGTRLQEHSGSEKAWVYSTVDFADEEQKPELFCFRFSSIERAQEFKTKFEDAMAHNDKALAADEEQGESPGDESTEAAKEKHAAEKSEADELAGKVGEVKVSEEDDKSSQA